MSKTNDIQKKVCETIITQCKFWMSSNDIDSSTNVCDIQETVDNIEELDDSENVKLVVALENILELLRNLDVKDETASDWNYMFTSEQDVIGGDFDIYVLMQRNKDINGNTMYVTEIGYEFFNRAY